MPFNQSIDTPAFFINENNQGVLNILKTVLAIPAEHNYTMKPESSTSNFFMIYDDYNIVYTSFSVEYDEFTKEFNLSMGCSIFPFESYDSESYEYTCVVILDDDINYLRTEVGFYSQEESDNMLIFIEEEGQISVSYLSPPDFFDEFILRSKNFMTDAFNYETFFLTDLYISCPYIFRTYSIADLFNARTDIILLNDMKQISDMATI